MRMVKMEDQGQQPGGVVMTVSSPEEEEEAPAPAPPPPDWGTHVAAESERPARAESTDASTARESGVAAGAAGCWPSWRRGLVTRPRGGPAPRYAHFSFLANFQWPMERHARVRAFAGSPKS